MDLEMFLSIVGSPETKRKVEAYRTETDEKKRAELKKTLPQALFQSYSTNGLRSKSTTKSNGLVLVDIDHIENPAGQFKERIEPLKELISLRLAYITASGNGLRLVCDIQPGTETIKENQEMICKVIGFDFDPSCCDFSRTSFLTTNDDILYLDEKMFTDEPAYTLRNADLEEEEKEEGEHSDAESDEEIIVNEDIAEAVILSGESNFSEGGPLPTGESGERGFRGFRGIPYSKIIADYWVDRGGVPLHGERHNEVLKFMHRLKFICDFDAEKMRTAIGDAFGLEEYEVKKMIKDVLAFPCSGKMPLDMYEILNRYGVADDITEVDPNDDQTYPVSDDDIPVDALPPFLRMYERIAPKGFKTAVIYIVTTVLAFYYTKLRAYYLDGLAHSPTLMMTLEAPMTSGKGFATPLVERLTKKVKADDDKARADEKAYKKELARLKNRKEQPQEPKSFIRIIPGRNSVSKILTRISKACGLHLFSFDSEISSILGNQRSNWADKSSLYRNSFDNDYFGQDYMSENAASEYVKVMYNFIYCGTPNEVDGLYSHIEDGTSSRLIPCTIPDQFGQKFPKWGHLSADEDKMIDSVVAEAESMTFDENGEIREETLVDMNWLYPTIEKWLEEKRLLALRNCDRAMDSLRKRSAVIGFRMSMIMYQLFGKKKDSREKIEKFFVWAATTTMSLQLNRFGEEVNAIHDQRMKKKITVTRVNKTDSLFDSLPDVFTVTDLETGKQSCGIFRESRKVISDFVQVGLVKKVAPGRWQKIE